MTFTSNPSRPFRRRAAIAGSIALAAVAAVAAAAPATGNAAGPPRFPSTVIVPGVSVGGVSIGQSFATARRRWGGRPSCVTNTFDHSIECGYVDSRDARTGYTYLKGTGDGKVYAIQLIVGAPGGRHLYVGPLTRLKTAKRIGFGSSLGAFRRAYPGAAQRRDPLNPTLLLFELKKGPTLTQFTFSERDKRLTSLNMVNASLRDSVDR